MEYSFNIDVHRLLQINIGYSCLNLRYIWIPWWAYTKTLQMYVWWLQWYVIEIFTASCFN